MTASQHFRRVLPYIAGLVVVSIACWLGLRLAVPSTPTQVAQAPAVGPPPASVQTDPVEVFRKAFWRHPGAEDKILHAERREWREKDNRNKDVVSKIIWFLAVEPSQDLVKYLRDDNAFRLVPAKTVPQIAGAPDWFVFRPDDVDVLEAPFGHMKLLFSKSSHRLYATDMSLGFRQGAPDPVKPPTDPNKPISKGPLPNAHPPLPSS